jgi:hypothetical protein
MSRPVDLDVDAKIITPDTEQVEINKEENEVGDNALLSFSCSYLDAECLSTHTQQSGRANPRGQDSCEEAGLENCASLCRHLLALLS